MDAAFPPKKRAAWSACKMISGMTMTLAAWMPRNILRMDARLARDRRWAAGGGGARTHCARFEGAFPNGVLRVAGMDAGECFRCMDAARFCAAGAERLASTLFGMRASAAANKEPRAKPETGP